MGHDEANAKMTPDDSDFESPDTQKFNKKEFASFANAAKEQVLDEMEAEGLEAEGRPIPAELQEKMAKDIKVEGKEKASARHAFDDQNGKDVNNKFFSPLQRKAEEERVMDEESKDENHD